MSQKIKLWLIRHGATEGNTKKRYIGVTDEPLLPESKEELRKKNYPMPQALYVSPLKRCIETAEILFPGKPMHIIDELSECNFGEFENKNYKELAGNAAYQAWVDRECTGAIPGGESREEFLCRSLTGFQKVVTACICEGVTCAALVIHGGTIMNIMEACAIEQKPFYDWYIKNGEGYQVEIDIELWKNKKRSIK
jgi:alpha-ribazole phosphatase